jgi:hypothetical protein
MIIEFNKPLNIKEDKSGTCSYKGTKTGIHAIN